MLLQSAGVTAAGSIGTATWTGTGSSGYAFSASVPITNGSISGFAIYVPADAAAFTQAMQAHQSKCDALSAQKDSLKDALKAIKKTGTDADIAAAKKNIDAVEDAHDAEFCGEDAWYADQMAAQQQLIYKMRAEEAASQDAAKKSEEASLQEECLEAAKKNDLATWQKLGCK